MATHSDILAWRIPWIEEPGGLQSMGSRRDTINELSLHFQNMCTHAFILFILSAHVY